MNVPSACCKSYNAIAGGSTLQGVKEWEFDILGSLNCISKKISLGVKGNFGANSTSSWHIFAKFEQSDVFAWGNVKLNTPLSVPR